jgi:hypothetical protein
MCVIETKRSKEAEIVAEPLFGTDQAPSLNLWALRGIGNREELTRFKQIRVYTYPLNASATDINM